MIHAYDFEAIKHYYVNVLVNSIWIEGVLESISLLQDRISIKHQGSGPGELIKYTDVDCHFIAAYSYTRTHDNKRYC